MLDTAAWGGRNLLRDLDIAGRGLYKGLYCEGMKACQMAGSTRRSRCKQISKWEPESTFRASSGVKEELSLCVCLWHTLCMRQSDYDVVPPQYP